VNDLCTDGERAERECVTLQRRCCSRSDIRGRADGAAIAKSTCTAVARPRRCVRRAASPRVHGAKRLQRASATRIGRYTGRASPHRSARTIRGRGQRYVALLIALAQASAPLDARTELATGVAERARRRVFRGNRVTRPVRAASARRHTRTTRARRAARCCGMSSRRGVIAVRRRIRAAAIGHAARRAWTRQR
jgi:hypothetical protein